MSQEKSILGNFSQIERVPRYLITIITRKKGNGRQSQSVRVADRMTMMWTDNQRPLYLYSSCSPNALSAFPPNLSRQLIQMCLGE